MFMAPIAWFGTGLTMTVRAPYLIYRAFAGEMYFHWLTWWAFYICISKAWSAAFALYREGFGLEVIGTLVAAGLWFAVLQVLTKPMMKASGALSFLAWMPGQGKLRSWIGNRAPATAPGAGAAKADEKLVRGAAIVQGAGLGAALKKGANKDDLAAVIEWGGVPIPPKAEPEHFLIEGKTGAGKTQAINEMMRKVRRRNQAAIIADPAGGYLARFGREGDAILNPFDRRSVEWSPFAEIRDDYDYKRIALAAIPDAREGADNTFPAFAQTLLTYVLKVMHQRGEHSIKRLMYYMMQAPRAELADLLHGTPAMGFLGPDNGKTFDSIRTTGCAPLSNWIYLPDKGTFSIRQWIRESDENPSFLFMTYTDAQMGELRNLIACWLELAIVEGLTLPESQKRRLWYVMDELDSLGKITSLRAGLTKLRKYGGVCVSGLQTIAQLRSTYGHDEAQTLLSCMTTKLILKAGDGETAKYFENEIGQQEVEREEISEGTSQRVGDFGSSSENKSVRRTTQAAVLASQITGLDNLHGYLMLTGQPIAKVQLDYVPMQDINAPYEAK